MVTQYCPGYMTDALGDLSYLKQQLRPIVRRHNIDTLVGIGLSGALVVPIVARGITRQGRALNWAVVRKDSDKSHNEAPFVGTVGDRWLFLDDLIDTGKSLAYVCQKVTEGRPWAVLSYSRETEFVGAYLYDGHEFLDAESRRIKQALTRGNARLESNGNKW